MRQVRQRLKGALIRLQAAWSILGVTLLALLVVELGFRGIFAVRDHLTAVSAPDPRVIAEGYAGASWPVDHYRELAQLEERWQPYVYFRQKPFRGKTINIGDAGLRANWLPPQSTADRGERRSLKILMLGGSSLWGYGARDDQTIPSLLARSLYEKGWGVELRNLAEIGYVSTQEVVALVRELQTGYRPDLVIFYDGVNDTTSALLEGEPGLTTNEVNRRHEFNLSQSPGRLAVSLAGKLIKDSGCFRFAQTARRILDRKPAASGPAPAAFKVPDVADGVVRHYEANLKLVHALAQSFGFRSLFFWQPTVFTKSSKVAVEREEAGRFSWAEPFMDQAYDAVKTSAQLKADPALFDDTGGLVFIDYCHTTETANARIAQKMAALVVGAQSQ